VIPLETNLLNRQRKVSVDRASLSAFLARLVECCPAKHAASWSVCLVSDRRIRELNREFRARDQATDVLSFPDDDQPDPDGTRYLGDVVISVATAERQAGEAGHSLDEELQILALHGYLHLMGHDHETDDGTMLRLQRRLERELIRAPRAS
jgi:probable rRNA maturation factor